ncbi:hypothetical protein MG293_015262 [Ovis ammon polii]|uniref:Uncharacterized protein n=1 Tax=Ovis ammon polii TaxID=230172 RepID=A0AAD4Y4U6_OVIAM|nr:hypothetical protein MG293_015262 [Ovis ammon polii]
MCSWKLLFILKDVDNVETDLTVDRESALCGGSRKQVPLPLLLSYLLKRKMVPGSSSLVPSRPEHEAVRRAFTKENNDSVTLKFPNEKRRKYFTLFFKDRRKALTALRLVQEKDTLTYVSGGTRFEDVFKSIVHKQNLMSLSLDCVPHSLEMASPLGEASENPIHSIHRIRGSFLMKAIPVCSIDFLCYSVGPFRLPV